MKRITWTTAIVASTLSLAIIAKLKTRNTEIEHRLIITQQRLISTEPISAPVPEATLETQQQITSTSTQIQQLYADISESEGSEGDFLRLFPDLLYLLQDLSVGQLTALAQEIKSPQNPVLDMVSDLIAQIVAKEDPLWALENTDLSHDASIRDGIFSDLARRSPRAALSWLEQANLDTFNKTEYQKTLAYHLLTIDLDAGIEFLRDNSQSGGRDWLRPLPPESIPQLVDAINQPANADLKDQLTVIALNSAIFDGGISGVTALAREIQPSQDQIADFLKEALSETPKDFIPFIQEFLPPDNGALPNAVFHWAQSDYNAAGEWLGQLRPSPARDKSISSFAMAITEVDPQAAAVWIGEIQDPAIREASLDTLRRKGLVEYPD